MNTTVINCQSHAHISSHIYNTVNNVACIVHCSTPNCDAQCGPGLGVAGPADQFGCSQCQCRRK